jgi:hypothetical protein
MKFIPEAHRHLHSYTIRPEGTTHTVVSVSVLLWFIRYIYYHNLQFLNNVIFLYLNEDLLPRGYLILAVILLSTFSCLVATYF